MFNISLENAIPTLVEALLPRGSGEKCLVVKIRASINDFRPEVQRDDDGVAGESREIQMVFRRPQGYTMVFVAIRDSRKDPLEWELTSYHDSCWRSDGFHPLTTLYFDMCKKVASDIPPRDLHHFVHIEGIQLVDSLPIEKGTDHYGPDRYTLKNFKGI